MVLSKTHLFLVLSTRFCTECEAVVMDQEVLGNLRRPWENSGIVDSVHHRLIGTELDLLIVKDIHFHQNISSYSIVVEVYNDFLVLFISPSISSFFISNQVQLHPSCSELPEERALSLTYNCTYH
ncbi:uncharacterized protein ACOB8E_012378 isoform 1-T3 [Sarcophilus harrisii]